MQRILSRSFVHTQRRFPQQHAAMAMSTFADNDVVVVSIARTPIGKISGALSSLSAPVLAAHAISAAVQRATDASTDNCFTGENIQEVIMGNVVSAGVGQAPGRQAVIYAGLPVSTPVTDVNKVCASGMKAIMNCALSISSGYRTCMLAGGMESMSNIPYYMPKATRSGGLKLGHATLSDGLIVDGLWDVYNNQHMGTCGDVCAEKLNISREEQDAFAIASYEKAAAAWSSGVMAREVVPVELPAGRNKQTVTVTTDEEFTSIKLDKVPTLRPAFGKTGTVTAANASKLSDGASAVVLCSGKEARARGQTPLFRILGFSDVCKEPAEFTTAPADAIPLAIAHANATTLKDRAEGPLTLSDVQYHEINEAFAVVALANAKLLGIDISTVNVHGGAVALGHPLGSSGCRIVGAVYNVLKEKGAKYGCASICNGGGGASAILIERLD